jgi:hypothetical protein
MFDMSGQLKWHIKDLVSGQPVPIHELPNGIFIGSFRFEGGERKVFKFVKF